MKQFLLFFIYRYVKPGLLRIAQVAGKPVVPTITLAQKKWVFNS